MVDYKYSSLFTKDSIDKQLLIKTDDGLTEITNTELHFEQFELEESICSESELRFGCCEASSIKFTISNVLIPLNGKWLTVTDTLDGNTDVFFQFGRYKVYSDKPSADRTMRDIEAYDAMYNIINTDVSDWYNTILPNDDSTVTLKEFRTSFLNYFGIEQEDVRLVNDDMVVEKTIEPSEISGKDVITAICEINGCFGHIGRNGKFQYIFLKKNIHGLYPANDLYPSDDLFPVESEAIGISKSNYISCQYEDFETQSIKKLQIRQEENDIGVIVGTEGNSYIVEDNFLVYGKSTEDLTTIANNLLSVIRGITYRPFEAEATGNPCLEVGDPVRLNTKYEIIESYILRRILKGIQGLRDTYEAEGEEYYLDNVNSTQKSIKQLKGKTNKLKRTIEETQLTIKDVEKGLQSQITQTAEKIETEVLRATEAEGELSSKITQTATQIKQTVAKYQYTWDETGYTVDYHDYGSPTSSSNKITYPVADCNGKYYLNIANGYLYLSNGTNWTNTNRLKKITTVLQSSITQTAESITAEVKRATEAEGTLSSKIEQTADEINLEVSKKVGNNEIISKINQTAESILISAEKIDIKGAVTAEYINSLKIKAGSVDAENITGTKISGKTIEGGSISIGSKFSVDKTGKATLADIVLTGNGSIDFKNSANNTSITIDASGFRTYQGSNGVEITPLKVEVGNTYIKPTEICVTSATNDIYHKTYIDGTYIKFGAFSSGGDYQIRDGSDNNLMWFSYKYASICADKVNICTTGKTLAFFSATGSTKKTVANISSSATLAQTVTALNSLIDALQEYGLIG